MKSLYERAVKWLDAEPTKEEDALMSKARDDRRVRIDWYSEGLVVGFVSGYKAAQADAKKKNRGGK